MAYDEQLAERLRAALAHRADVSERPVFGSWAFMVAGNLCCCATDEGVLVRLGPERASELRSEPGAKEFAMTGRRMRNWLLVEPATVAEDSDLVRWVGLAEEFAASLPAK